MSKRLRTSGKKRTKNGSKIKQEFKVNDIKSENEENTFKKAQPEAGNVNRAFIVELIITVVLLAAICTLRTVHLFANNVDEVVFADLGNDMWIFMAISIAVFAILRIFLRKPYFAGMFVALATFLAVNFSLLVSFMRLFISKYNPAAIGGVVLYVVLVVGFVFLLRVLFKKKLPVHIFAKILSATFAGLVLFNAVLAIVAMGKTLPVSMAEAAATTVPSATVAATTPEPTVEATPEPTVEATPTPTEEPLGKPNIYYFILDEYGSFEMMSKYYDYDNQVFKDFLLEKGFNISSESYSTDTQTEQSIADTLNLEYISRYLSKSESTKEIGRAKIYTILTDLGYSQFQLSIGDRHFQNIVSLETDTGARAYEEIVNLFGDENSDDVVSDSSIFEAFSLFLEGQYDSSDVDVEIDGLNEWGFYPSSYIRDTKAYRDHKLGSYANHVLKLFDYFEDPSNYTKTTPRVTYSYMSASHVPFLFNEYGDLIPYSQNRNWEDPNIYLNQYKFVTKHMMASVATIIENDPDSIIIVTADHGIRYHADCNKKHTFYITDKDSLRIINAVYIKGQQYDIEGLSAINTLRFVLSLYDGLDYPPIEDPITSDSPDSLRGIIPRPR